MRDREGKFTRKHNEWSLDNFDDGYINCGRFKSIKKGHPRSNLEGYVLRSILVYEEYSGIQVTPELCIHHRDGNKLNDSIENLELIEFNKHSKMHNESKKNGENRVCAVCGEEFYVPRWRLNQKYHVGKYCSTKCFFRREKNY